jgi:hypothetical protein
MKRSALVTVIVVTGVLTLLVVWNMLTQVTPEPPIALPNENWELSAVFDSPNSDVLIVSLTNVSQSARRAFPPEDDITIHPRVVPVLEYGCGFELSPGPSQSVPPGASFREVKLNLSGPFLLSTGEWREYVGRIIYDDTYANHNVAEGERSTVGLVYSKPFGFRLRGDKTYDVWPTRQTAER